MSRGRRVLKWIGIGLGGLVALVLVAAVILYFVGGARLNKRYDIAVAAVPVPTGAEVLARGQHIATAIGMCTSCHGEDLSGNVDFAIPGMLTIPTPNLTSGAGGVGGVYSDEEWVRAIRHGVGRDRRELMIMPSGSFSHLSADDLGALIAYLKSAPPVDNVLPERSIELPARLMAGAGMFPAAAAATIDHSAPPPPAPEIGVTAAYGAYLTRTCTECHGAELNGKPFGPPGQEVPSPNLTPGGELVGWSEEQFFHLMRTGITPTERRISDEMPWKAFGRMTDDELRAVWLYLQSLPALEQGG